MEPTSVLDTVLRGEAKPGWAIFNFAKGDALKGIFFRMILLLIFGGATTTFVYTAPTYGTTNYLFAGIFGVIDFYLFISIVGIIRNLYNAKRNMIIFTDKEVVKSLNGKVEDYPYDIIKSPRITNPMAANMPAMTRRPAQYVDFTDSRTGRMVELTNNRQFGPPEPIFNFLNSKLI